VDAHYIPYMSHLGPLASGPSRATRDATCFLNYHLRNGLVLTLWTIDSRRMAFQFLVTQTHWVMYFLRRRLGMHKYPWTYIWYYVPINLIKEWAVSNVHSKTTNDDHYTATWAYPSILWLMSPTSIPTFLKAYWTHAGPVNWRRYEMRRALFVNTTRYKNCQSGHVQLHVQSIFFLCARV
jgi:hypothetical protein